MKATKYFAALVMAIIVASPTLCSAGDVTITFTDSTKIEDTWIKSSDALANFGRNASGGADRVLFQIGPNYNTQNALVRIIPFYDSIANHPGMIIDSGKLTIKILAEYMSDPEYMYIRAIGIDSNRNWGEGNLDAAAALNCGSCWDSARTVGAGTCADNLDWSTDGGAGTGDTIGTYNGKPSDSVLIDFNSAIWGASFDIWIDTVTMNLWKDYSYANEGMLLKSTTNSGAQCMILFYGSETRLTGRLDSIPVFTVYGHTGAAAPVKKPGNAHLGNVKL